MRLSAKISLFTLALLALIHGSALSAWAGLVGHWPGEGDAHDAAGNVDGALVDGVGFAPGEVGQAFSFNGTGYVDLGVSTGNFGAADFTISCWVKLAAVEDPAFYTRPLISKGLDDSHQLSVWVSDSGHITVEAREGENWAVFSEVNKAIDDEQWHHLALVRHDVLISLYVDGVFGNSSLSFDSQGSPKVLNLSDPEYTAAPLVLGGNLVTGQRCVGLIDEVQLYDSALTRGGILSLYPDNHTPVLSVPGTQALNEGDTLSFSVSAADPDGDPLTYSMSSAPNIGIGALFPTSATFVDLQDNTGTFSWTPGIGKAGTYLVNFRATDGSLSDEQWVRISVYNNRAPRWQSVPGNKEVNENIPLSFSVSATDPDAGQILRYAALNLPAGATLNPSTGAFAWTPTFEQAGEYEVQFTATDNGIVPKSIAQTATNTGRVQIRVNEVNRPPVLSVPGAQAIDEGEALYFSVSGTDPDGDVVSLSTDGTAAVYQRGAFFDEATGEFRWDSPQPGTYTVSFAVNDGKELSGPQSVAITVRTLNRAPTLSVPGAQVVNEGVELAFAISAVDPDGDEVSYSATGLPSGAILHSNGAFSWTPGAGQAGRYTLRFTAADHGTPQKSDTKTVAMVVKRVPVCELITGSQPLTRWYWGTVSEPSGYWQRSCCNAAGGDTIVWISDGYRYWQEWLQWVANGSNMLIQSAFDSVFDNYRFLGWGYASPSEYYSTAVGESRPATGDLDGDGVEEIVVGFSTGGEGKLEVLSYAAPDYIVEIKDQQRNRANLVHRAWLQLPWWGFYGDARPAVGDLDGDGKAEIVVGLGPGGEGRLAIFSSAAEGYVFKQWIQLPWSEYNDANGTTIPAMGDVDGDGRDEIIVGLAEGGAEKLALFGDATSGYAFERWLQLPLPSSSLTLSGRTWPALGDVDGDGRDEIVVGMGRGGKGYLAVLEDASADYALVKWLQLPDPTYNNANGETHPAVGDVDGDGKAEIVVGRGFQSVAANYWYDWNSYRSYPSALFEGADSGFAFTRWIDNYLESSWPALGHIAP